MLHFFRKIEYPTICTIIVIAIVNNKQKQMAERLDAIFNNPKNDDNTVIIRCLNTVLENGPSSSLQVYRGLGYFAKLFAELIKENKIKRPDIEFVVEHIQAIDASNSFAEFKKVLENIYEKDMADYKYLFLMSYWRVLFEIFYEKKIAYTKPEFAIMQANGHEPWNVFLNAFKNSEYNIIA